MPTISVYNQEGKQIGDIALSDKIFGVKPNPTLVHEVVIAEQANDRQAVASTKTRGQVRGGGKKPWKQKGTGRARQGSIRSPQWVGGGIVFGPSSERNFTVKINKKTRRKALFMILSDKVASQRFVVIDAITTAPAKTKAMASLLKKLPIDKTVLMVTPVSDAALLRMIRNLPNVKLTTPNAVSLLDVMNYRTLVFLKDAVPAFEKIYA